MLELEYPTYLDAIRRESARFRAVLADCDPDAPVPSCPEWSAADLLWHLAGVQLFWSRVVRLRPATPDDEAISSLPAAERPAAYAQLLEAFDGHSHALTTELERADPAEPAWHWSGDLRVGTTYRRQAHEALIHRVDAELAAGLPVRALDPALADDGVAEVLGVVYGGLPAWGSFAPSGESVAVRLTDTGTELRVALGTFSGTDPEDGRSYEDEVDLQLVPASGSADATVSGSAADVDLWLWKRGPADAVAVEGDRLTFEKLAGILAQPIT